MEKSYKGCFFSLVGLILVGLVSFTYGRCSVERGEGSDTLSVDSTIIHDTLYVYKTDSFPVVKKQKVLEYVQIPCPEPTSGEDTAQVTLPVVQKTFSDDSTYTAYVSGLEYDNLPKLDSITVRQREITNTITKTITIKKKRSRWNIGFQGGYGYGIKSKEFEPYVGIGFTYSLF